MVHYRGGAGAVATGDGGGASRAQGAVESFQERTLFKTEKSNLRGYVMLAHVGRGV